MSELPDGLRTAEEAKNDGAIFVGYNNDTKMLSYYKSKDEAVDLGDISGELLGFDSHTFPFKNQTFEKFDIWLRNKAGRRIQIQLGMETWVTLHIMNALLGIPHKKDEPIGKGTLRIACYKKDDSGRAYMEWNGEKIGWKFKLGELPEKVRIVADMPKDEAEKRKNKLIAQFFEELKNLKHYDPKAAVSDVAAADDEDDKIPF